MGIRRFALCTMFLAILAVSEANASTDDVEPSSGEVRLVFSSDKISSLPINVEALENNLCGGWPESPRGRCILKMGTERDPTAGGDPTVGEHPILRIRGTALSPRRAEWQVISLEDLDNAPIETSCGLWDFSLVLEEIEAQPISAMILESDHIAGSGLYTSILKVRVWLHLVNRDTGETVDFPLVLGVGLTGIWNTHTSSDPGMSNLSLFNGEQDQCFPVWVLESPGDWEGSLEGSCQFCFKGVQNSSTPPDGDSF